MSPSISLTATCSVSFAASAPLSLMALICWHSLGICHSLPIVSAIHQILFAFLIHSFSNLLLLLFTEGCSRCWGSLSLSALKPGSAWEVTSPKAATSQCWQAQEYKYSLSLSPNQVISHVEPTLSPELPLGLKQGHSLWNFTYHHTPFLTYFFFLTHLLPSLLVLPIKSYLHEFPSLDYSWGTQSEADIGHLSSHCSLCV